MTSAKYHVRIELLDVWKNSWNIWSDEQDYELRRPDASIVEQQVGAKRLRFGIEELSIWIEELVESLNCRTSVSKWRIACFCRQKACLNWRIVNLRWRNAYWNRRIAFLLVELTTLNCEIGDWNTYIHTYKLYWSSLSGFFSSIQLKLTNWNLS